MNGMNQVTLTLKICVACVYPALTQSWLRFPSHSVSVSPLTPLSSTGVLKATWKNELGFKNIKN